MYVSPLAHVFSAGALSGPGGAPLAALESQLAQLKAAPVLNPHFNMVHAYLDVLNALAEPLLRTQGPGMGARSWLVEVQAFTRQVHRRAFAGIPLNADERTAVLRFVAYWRMAGQPYGTGTPEAQIVLLTLGECVSR